MHSPEFAPPQTSQKVLDAPEFTTHGAKPPSLAEGATRPRFELASSLGPNATESEPDRNFAPEVLHTARDGWNEMHQEHPDFYKGMTVYGSLVKGRGHEKSDVDAVIFYDPDSSYAQSFDSYAGMVSQPNEDIGKHINTHFQQQGYGETFQGVGSYSKVAINERIIDDNIAFAEQAGQRSETAAGGIDPSLVDLFHMRVGDGDIQGYRQRVVDSLAASVGGEAIWKEIMDQLGTKEEMRRGAEIHLPTSLDEAVGYFHLKPLAGRSSEQGPEVTPENVQAAKTRLRRMRKLAGRVLDLVT